MQQFIPFEDDWAMAEAFAGHRLVPYQPGMACAQRDATRRRSPGPTGSFNTNSKSCSHPLHSRGARRYDSRPSTSSRSCEGSIASRQREKTFREGVDEVEDRCRMCGSPGAKCFGAVRETDRK